MTQTNDDSCLNLVTFTIVHNTFQIIYISIELVLTSTFSCRQTLCQPARYQLSHNRIV